MVAERFNILTSTAGPSDNAAAVATLAAPGAGKRNVLVGIQSSYDSDAPSTKETQIAEGASVKWRMPMKANPFVLVVPTGACIYRGTLNTEVTVTLQASGTAGMKGTVNVQYFVDQNG